ncbi:MAG: hypothetical protein ACW98D_21420 [Promethearchaeota archaeon]|jgi:hypothetical protein
MKETKEEDQLICFYINNGVSCITPSRDTAILRATGGIIQVFTVTKAKEESVLTLIEELEC